MKTQDKAQHTPTPWRSVNGAIFDTAYSTAPLRFPIAMCGDINAPRNESGNIEANELNKANAAFIVRACNAFEENNSELIRQALRISDLKKQNEALLEALKNLLEVTGQRGDTVWATAKIMEAQKAIAQAEEK